MGRALRLATLGVPVGGGGAWSFETTDISITPTPGPELLTNGNFSAWTADNPDGWAVPRDTLPDNEVSEVGTGEGHGGTGSGLCNIYYASGSATAMSQSGKMTVGKWYTHSIVIDTAVALGIGVPWAGEAAGVYQRRDLVSPQTKVHTFRAQTTAYEIVAPTAVADITIENVSLKLLSDTMQLVDHGITAGRFSVWITSANDAQGGVVATYTDINNYQVAFIDLGKLFLMTVVGGTPTVSAAYNITPVADGQLTLQVNPNGTRDLFYNANTIATGIAASGLTGTKAGPFLTNSALIAISKYRVDLDFA